METIEDQAENGTVQTIVQESKELDTNMVKTVIIDATKYCELIVSHLPLRRLDPVLDQIGEEFLGLIDETSNTRFLLPKMELQGQF